MGLIHHFDLLCVKPTGYRFISFRGKTQCLITKHDAIMRKRIECKGNDTFTDEQ